MKVTNIPFESLPLAAQYTKRSFPNRVHAEQLMNFLYQNDKESFEKNIFLVGDMGEIKGMGLYKRCSFIFDGKNENALWGFDLFVDENIRPLNYGLDILAESLAIEEPVFATGSGEFALKIEMKMGAKLLGEIKKYVAFWNPVFLPFSFKRGVVRPQKYPEIINEFEKVSYVDFEYNGEINKNTKIEFVRDKRFISWRYNGDLHNYMIYKSQRSSDYFVVRTIVQKGITALSLVDYRCNGGFEHIVKTLKLLSRKLKLSFVIASSSMQSCDNILEKAGFKAKGRNRPIIVFSKKFKQYQEMIDKREFINITFADSDGEWNWR